MEGENGETDWYIDYLFEALGSTLGIGVVVVGIIVLMGIIMFLIKRRYDDVMGGLEDLDQDFSDDDDDFDDEEC